jgi:hypothetical protein
MAHREPTRDHFKGLDYMSGYHAYSYDYDQYSDWDYDGCYQLRRRDGRRTKPYNDPCWG